MCLQRKKFGLYSKLKKFKNFFHFFLTRCRRDPRSGLQCRRWRGSLVVSEAVQMCRRNRGLPEQEVDDDPQTVSGGHHGSVSIAFSWPFRSAVVFLFGLIHYKCFMYFMYFTSWFPSVRSTLSIGIFQFKMQ